MHDCDLVFEHFLAQFNYFLGFVMHDQLLDNCFLQKKHLCNSSICFRLADEPFILLKLISVVEPVIDIWKILWLTFVIMLSFLKISVH